MSLFRIWLEIKSGFDLVILALSAIIVITWILLILIPAVKSDVKRRKRK